MVQNFRRGAPNRLHAVLKRGDAVDKVKSVRGGHSVCMSSVEDFDLAHRLEIFRFAPIHSLLLALAVGVAAALERLQWLLQGLGYITVVDHAAP